MARSIERHYGVPLNRVHVAYNAVELPACDAVAARLSVRQELGIASEAKLILMIGRLDAQKNWPMFIRVRDTSRHCETILTYFIGIGAGALRDELEETVRKDGLEERVRFVGAKLREMMIHLWRASLSNCWMMFRGAAL